MTPLSIDTIEHLVFSPTQVDFVWATSLLDLIEIADDWRPIVFRAIYDNYRRNPEASDGFSRVAWALVQANRINEAVEFYYFDFSMNRMRRWQFLRFIECLVSSGLQHQATNVINAFYSTHSEAKDGWAILALSSLDEQSFGQKKTLFNRDYSIGRLSQKFQITLAKLEYLSSDLESAASVIGRLCDHDVQNEALFATIAWDLYKKHGQLSHLPEWIDLAGTRVTLSLRTSLHLIHLLVVHRELASARSLANRIRNMTDSLEESESSSITRLYPTLLEAASIGIDPSQILNEPLPKCASHLNHLTCHIDRLSVASSHFSKGPILINALPKSGGSWITTLVSLVTGFPKSNKSAIKQCPPLVSDEYGLFYSLFSDFTRLKSDSLSSLRNRPYTLHTHLPPTRSTTEALNHAAIRPIILQRDLRDVMVSLYYHLRERSGPEKEALNSLDVNEGLLYVMERYMNEFAMYLSDWIILTRKHNYQRIHYEQFVIDPSYWIDMICTHYGIAIDPSTIRAVVDAFDRKSLVSEGTINTIHTAIKFRSGEVGDWKTHFSKRHISLYDSIVSRFPNILSQNACTPFNL